MDNELPPPLPPAAIDPSPPPRVADAGAPATAANAPAESVAAALTIKHGGRKGGRGRADGLVPGSPEAIQKDKERDAERKRQQRAARSKIVRSDPPPLPASAPLSGATDALGDDTDALLDTAGSALVLWRGTDIEPVLVEIIEGLEEWRKWARDKKFAMSNLLPDEVEEMRKDAAWSDRLKKLICENAGRVLAKLGNKSGISAEHKDEVILIGAITALAVGEFRFNAKMDKYIAKYSTLKKNE